MITPLGPVATVLIPTHDHAQLLQRSVRSALDQTVQHVEVFIVGDGVSDDTRAVVNGLAHDARVRFFDNRAKGASHGERYRHAALAQARGRIVCYLADDDLWLPDHVETMVRLLEAHQFAHTLPFRVEPDGSYTTFQLDLSMAAYRWVTAGRPLVNRIPLSMGAHTLEIYRRLPYGWRDTPRRRSITGYQWAQILNAHPCRATSAFAPTALHFPSRLRASMTMAARVDEIDRFARRLADAAFRQELMATLPEERSARAARQGVRRAIVEGAIFAAFPFPKMLGRAYQLVRGRR